MELRALIVSLLCVVHALEGLPSEKIVDLSQREIDDGTDRQSTEKFRDKRALGLFLSGLAQIFGYTVTPIQLASLPNPNTTRPAAMSNSSMMMGMMMGMMPNKTQQAAASRPANATMPRRQETIRFTGVVNFGNNSDIIGHLQRYEQIFHGRGNNTTMMSTMSPPPMPPAPMPPAPMPPAKLSVDLRTNVEDRPPLLAPFFVKIPLPIAPDLLPATMPIEDLPVSYLAPPISIVSTPDEYAETPIVPPSPQAPPVRKKPVYKEEEMIYRNNEDAERYMIHEKEIYDEKDVRKPNSKHQLYIDEPKWKQQQEERYNELQRNQEERVERLKDKEEERNRDKNVHYKEEEMNERYKNREEEIDNRNRNQVSKYESEEEEEPVYKDASDEKETENSAETYEEHDDRANLQSDGSSKQSLREDESEKAEDYPNYEDDDEPNKQSHGHKQPENFDKYIVIGYNQQLPIGDYFHEGSPEVIRDSYGKVLDNKKLEDDRLAGYVNMFQQPYFDYNVQNTHNSEDASREDEKTAPASGYDAHLARVHKLREEYGLPENKYEEYEIENESDANGDDKESEKITQNHTSAKQDGSTTNLRGKEDGDARSEHSKSQEEIDFVRYVPLVVPVRYVDTSDKTHQAETRQLNYKESDKLTNSEPVDDNVSMPTRSNSIPKVGLPGKPRQLHEGEIDKQLQLWPPPFDYVFDTTEPINTVVPPNLPNYYQPIVKTIVANNARNDNSVEQPSGYLVVVGDPNRYRYPYNVYYFPNEAVDPQRRDLYSNIEDAQNQVYIPQQSVNQQFVQLNPNLTKYNLNETARSSQNYYHQSRGVPVNVLDRYYVSGDRPRAEESPNIDVINQIVDNWSNKIHRARDDTDGQNVAFSNQNTQRILSERSRNIQLPRRRRSSQQEDKKEDKNEDKNDKKEETTSQQPISENESFDDPESAHDFFGFNKDDYSFEGESSDASEVEKKDDKTATELSTVPEPITYRHDDESMMRDNDELENDPEKVEVTEYRNKVATLKVSEQRQSELNGPIQYVNFIRTI